MFDDPTLFAALLAAFAASLAMLSAGRLAGRGPADRPERLADGRLRCPHCGAVNDPAYRFCRDCVGELQGRAPTAPSEPAGGRSPFG